MDIAFDALIVKFLIALAVGLPVYYLLPRRLQNYWLLLVSFAFVASWTWYYAIVLLVVTLVNFLLAQEVQAARERPYGRSLMWAGIVFNILGLASLKYARFFVRRVPESLAPRISAGLSFFDLTAWPVGLNELMPIGLSFITLSLIAYLVDVRRGQLDASSDLADFALYVVYFPKIISGPIERAQSFLPQLKGPRVVDDERLRTSLTLLLIGAFRKLVIAAPLQAMLPPDLFENPSAFPAPVLAGWLVAYGLQIYNDFAGYTNMARGISGLIGIELSPNFQNPYLARNFTEFWNRWHITLSHWLRDYIFFPVTRALRIRIPNRRHVLNLVLPPMATMLVSGLWHQASAHMLFWGGLHGLFLVGVQVLALRWPMPPPDQQPRWRQILAGVVVFVLAMLAWVPFATTLPQTVDTWRGLLNWSVVAAPDFRIIMLLVPSFLLDFAQNARRDEFVILRWPVLARAATFAVILLALFLALRADMGIQSFVYQGF